MAFDRHTGKRGARRADVDDGARRPLPALIGAVSSASRRVRAGFDASAARSLHVAAVSGLWNVLLGIGKIASGALALSIFACVNGLYTLGMGAARLVTATGATRAGAGSTRRYARWAGIALMAASALYVAYAMWTYVHPVTARYSKMAALAIATFTFAEIGLNGKNLVQTRGAKGAIEKALRIIGLASSIIALGLTQEAILSFQGGGHDPAVNAYIRCLTGSVAFALGMYIVLRTRATAPKANGWR